jgi:hypothetical protein
MSAERSQQGGGLVVLSAVVLAADLAVLAAATVAALFVVPRFRRVFAEMGAELPRLTRLHLSTPLAAHLGLLALLAAGLIAKEVLVRRPNIRLLINVLVLVFLLLAAGVYVLALFLPMVQMVQAMQ